MIMIILLLQLSATILLLLTMIITTNDAVTEFVAPNQRIWGYDDDVKFLLSLSMRTC